MTTPDTRPGLSGAGRLWVRTIAPALPPDGPDIYGLTTALYECRYCVVVLHPAGLQAQVDTFDDLAAAVTAAERLQDQGHDPMLIDLGRSRKPPRFELSDAAVRAARNPGLPVKDSYHPESPAAQVRNTVQ